MSDLTNIPVRNIGDLVAIEVLPENSSVLSAVKIPVGNLPAGVGGEAITINQLRNIIASEVAEGSEQQKVNDRVGNTWRNKVGGYALHDRVMLDNGNIVVSTTNKNIKNPNLDPTGWASADAAVINSINEKVNTEKLRAEAAERSLQSSIELKAPQSTTFTKTEVTGLIAPKVDKTYVDTALSGFTNGASKFYATLALANADIANIGIKDKVDIGEVANGGTWYKAAAGATTLTKSAYDPLTQAKADATTKANAAEKNALVKVISQDIAEKKGNLHFDTGFVSGNLKTDGTLEVSASRSCTDGFLLINPTSQYTVDSASSASLASLSLYDKDQNFVSYITKAQWGVETPLVMSDNAMFARFCIANTGIATFKIKVTTKASVSAKQYAEAKLVEAKTYTDNVGKLINPLVGSKAKSKKLIGIIADGRNVSTDPIVTQSNIRHSSKDVFSYLIPVKPNTTYTLIYNITTHILGDFRGFTKELESYQTTVIEDAAVTRSGFSGAPNPYRYATVTVPANINYLVFDPKRYADDYDWILCEGVFATSMVDSFATTSQNKTLNADVINVKQINSEMFAQSKNLFNGYTFGLRTSPAVPVNVVVAGTATFHRHPDAPDYKQVVSAFIAVDPNTTYTISKEPSDEFVVSINNSAKNSGKILLRDVSKTEFTFTTEADTAWIFVMLSQNYQQPLVQVEKGNKATFYVSSGLQFKGGALPVGKKLGEPKVQPKNTYIDLGVRTDKYALNLSQIRTSTLYDDFYDPLVADFPHLVSKTLLGKDTSGLYDIFQYTFEPEHYEQTIAITAGMHASEVVPPFALATLLDEAYRHPEKHEGLAYLRNKTKIVIIPVVNPWGFNQHPKVYANVNGVNPSRNFPERWDVLRWDNQSDGKGTAPLSEAESQHMYTMLSSVKDELSFYLDCHTAQGFTEDTMLYWQEDDDFLRPALENIVSMLNDKVRQKYGRETNNQTFETQRATQSYHPWRVWGVPTAIVEYPTGSTQNMDSAQMTYYCNLLFNCVWSGLKERIPSKIKQAKLNEHNKQYISLYNTLTGYNDVINQKWTYARWQANCYDKLGLTKSVVGAASGTYELVKYVHAPAGYKNTVVLCAGFGTDARKSVTELGFFAHKLMTDSNPHIVALRNSTRFIFLPVLNPHGHDNGTWNNANGVQPYSNFASSTQPESVSLRSFIDTETIDLFVDVSSLSNTYKPAGYADCQIIHNAKADAEYQSVFGILKEKYAVAINSNVANYSTSLIKSQIADYINSKGIAYSNHFFAKNVLPLRTTSEALITPDVVYTDYGYEANELAYCTEVLMNNIKEICQRRTLSKYLAN